jgi:hypothetical protein
MIQLPYYRTIAEREKYFERIPICNFTELLKCLQKDFDSGCYFRGQADSSWKLYSFLQREYIQKGFNSHYQSITELFRGLIDQARKRYFSEISGYCQIQHDLAVGSVLQHYGCPTPFVDFSESIDVALFFATEMLASASNFETNNFISVYVINEGGTAATPEHDLMNYSRIFSEFKNKIEMIRNAIEDINVNYPHIDELNELAFFSQYQMLLLKDTDEEWLKIKNPRLDLQKGLFIYSGQSALIPYEEIMQPLSGNASYCDKLIFDKIKVYDIPKSIRSDIKKYLEIKKISSSSLGFQTDSWGKKLYNDFISPIIK